MASFFFTTMVERNLVVKLLKTVSRVFFGQCVFLLLIYISFGRLSVWFSN